MICVSSTIYSNYSSVDTCLVPVTDEIDLRGAQTFEGARIHDKFCS